MARDIVVAPRAWVDNVVLGSKMIQTNNIQCPSLTMDHNTVRHKNHRQNFNVLLTILRVKKASSLCRIYCIVVVLTGKVLTRTIICQTRKITQVSDFRKGFFLYILNRQKISWDHYLWHFIALNINYQGWRLGVKMNKFHIHQCQAQIEIWCSPDVHLTTWPSSDPDPYQTLALHNLD